MLASLIILELSFDYAYRWLLEFIDLQVSVDNLTNWGHYLFQTRLLYPVSDLEQKSMDVPLRG